MKPRMYLRPLPEQLAALGQIKQHKAEILAERGGKPLNIDTVAILQRMREERDGDLFDNFVNRRG